MTFPTSLLQPTSLNPNIPPMMTALDEEAACLSLKAMKSVLNIWKGFEKARAFEFSDAGLNEKKQSNK